MRRRTTKPRRLGKHVTTVLDHLTKIGATDVRVTAPAHVHFRWCHQGRSGFVTMASTPRDGDNAARVTIQRINRQNETTDARS